MPREVSKPGFGKRKFEDQANGRERVDWREELIRYLIAGGTTGQKQSEIQRRLAAHARSVEIDIELEGLLASEKVQKFSVPASGRGKPATVWRATTKILENDDE